MSGGSYEYAFYKIQDFADVLREEGSCSAAPAGVRRAFAEHCRKVANAMHACEWNDSGDGHDDELNLIMQVLSPPEVALSAASRLRENIREAEMVLALLEGE